MNHPGLEALIGQWDKAEYAAGYQPPLSAIPDFDGAHPNKVAAFRQERPRFSR
jgi:hypothetical protein